MDTNATIEFLKEALLDEPDNLDLRIKLAAAYMNATEVEKARKQLGVVLQKDATNQQAIQMLEMIDRNDTNETETFPKGTSITTQTSDEDSDSDTPIRQTVGGVGEEDTDYAVQSMFEKANTSFADIGGMHDLKEEIKVSIVYPFEKPELYEKYGKKIGGGILLYGPPGCGKTHIARATAGEISALFLSVGIDDILEMWIGESEKKIHKLFSTARRLSPAVLFFDEVDALGADRMKIKAASSAMVNQFLTEMDGIHTDNDKIMVIGATNTPWQVDPAFRRPGRFDKIVFVPPPDDLARAEIFKIHLKDKPAANIDYIELAKRTKHFSGADITKVCDQTVETVIREVLAGGKERDISMDDFIKNLKTIQPTTLEWFATAKNFARYANESGTYTPIIEYMKKTGLN